MRKTMNLEIVGFYELERDDTKESLKGTLLVYMVDLGIDLRGIIVIRKKERILIYMPHKIGIDEETKTQVRYPVFAFTDVAKNKELTDQIRKIGVPFIKEEILKIEKKKFKRPRSNEPIKPKFEKKPYEKRVFDKPKSFDKPKTFSTRNFR